MSDDFATSAPSDNFAAPPPPADAEHVAYGSSHVVAFSPPHMTTRFDPAGDPKRPYVTVGPHRFRNGTFDLEVPADFRTDLTSAPIAQLVNGIVGAGVAVIWLFLTLGYSRWWALAAAGGLQLVLWKLQQLCDPRGLHQRAALWHDLAYSLQFCSRSTADQIFRTILEHDGVSWWRIVFMYYALRFFGGRAWKQNQGRLTVTRQEMYARCTASSASSS